VVWLLLALSYGWTQEEGRRHVTGTVVDQSGAPVPRVLIEIGNPKGPVVASSLTDQRGRFAFDLADGSYTLNATATGLAPIKHLSFDVSAITRPINLTMAIAAINQSIVVTATRTEAPLTQVGSNTTVIRGDDLQKGGFLSVADVLRRVPGLAVAQNGSNGQLASLFMRGGESDYTKVLIDGIPANDPGGSFNFANLSAASIDRIEIVRGPQSALFGSDAMAGVIQIFTRRGASEGLEPRPDIAVEGGSLATFRYQAGIGGKGERFDYAASFARMDTDNNVLNGSFNDAAVSGNLGFRPSHKSQLRIVFRSDAGRAGVPGQWAFHRPDPDQFYRHRSLAGGVTFTYISTPSWLQTLSYAVNDSRQYSEDRIDNGSFVSSYRGRMAPFASYDFAFQTLNQSRRQKISYQNEISLGHAHRITSGVEYEREDGTVGDPRNEPLVAVRNNAGGFFQDEWFLHKRLFATAGVRVEHNGSFALAAAPRLSLAWHARQPAPDSLLSLTKIKANFGTGIKEPTLVESFSKSPYFQGNPDLKAEKSTSYDVGIEQYFSNGKGAVEVSFFENRFRNQIDFITTDYSTFAGTFFNIGKTRARGIETNFQQSFGRYVELSGSYTFLDSVVLENIAAFDPALAQGQPLLRRPRHSGYLDLKWKPGRWTFGATGTLVGRRADSDFAGLEFTRNPAYGVLDLLASFRLFSGSFVYVVVNNALDRKYMEVLGYPALPARFRIGFTTGF
jgi:iron complex outermembrane receptor protein/vitamin B12 transporter